MWHGSFFYIYIGFSIKSENSTEFKLVKKAFTPVEAMDKYRGEWHSGWYTCLLRQHSGFKFRHASKIPPHKKMGDISKGVANTL
jgi:hypothetical protein